MRIVSYLGATIICAFASITFADGHSTIPEADNETIQLAQAKGTKPLSELLGLKRNKYPRKGSVCKIRGIRGEDISSISRGSCGIKNPIRVTEIDGVKLTNGATLNCNTATALYEWLDEVVKPEIETGRVKLSAIHIADSYSCRTINNRKNANLSQHSYGNAVDVASFTLSNNNTLSVERDWRSQNSKIMKKFHEGACGYFGTVLGPNADKNHQDHFHLDVKVRSYGSYCR